MIKTSGEIPCGIYPGLLYHLEKPFKCGMLKIDGWDQGRLYKEIIKKSGEDAEDVLDKFQTKEWDLKIIL